MLFVLDYYAVIINETRIAMSLFLVKTGLPRLTRLTRDARKDSGNSSLRATSGGNPRRLTLDCHAPLAPLIILERTNSKTFHSNERFLNSFLKFFKKT